MTSEELAKINKDYFAKVTSMAAKTVMFSNFPFLNIQPLNFITSQLIDMFVKYLADALELVSFYAYIDLRVDKQGKDYVNAKKKGLEIELTGTPEEKKIAEQKIIDTFKLFAKFTS